MKTFKRRNIKLYLIPSHTGECLVLREKSGKLQSVKPFPDLATALPVYQQQIAGVMQ